MHSHMAASEQPSTGNYIRRPLKLSSWATHLKTEQKKTLQKTQMEHFTLATTLPQLLLWLVNLRKIYSLGSSFSLKSLLTATHKINTQGSHTLRKRHYNTPCYCNMYSQP